MVHGCGKAVGGRGHWRSERGTGRQYRKRVSCDRSAGVKAIGFSHCIWRIDRDCGTCGCAVRGVRVAPDRMGCDTIKNHYTSYSTAAIGTLTIRIGSPTYIPTRPYHSVHGAWRYRTRIDIDSRMCAHGAVL